jgi:hypothetical protein
MPQKPGTAAPPPPTDQLPMNIALSDSEARLGTGNSVYAADDNYKLDGGETLLFSTQNLTSNDRGPDGGCISLD